MSLYQKASLVQIPSGYKASADKLYSVVPNNGDGDFTVTVAADATRVNKDGLIESVVADQARLNYDPSSPQDPTLLLEPARQNIIQYSELFNNSYWTKENSSIGTGIVSPMGDTDAQNVIEDTTTGRHRVRASLAVSSGTTYSLSVWAKSTNRNLVINADVLINARSGFDLINGTVQNTTSGTATIKEFPNGWYLCTVKGTATTTQTTVAYLQAQIGTTDANYTGDGNSTLSLFGAQLEAGSATSYIPTSGSAVTRTLDKCLNAGSSGLFNDTEGTLFVDLENFDENTRELTLSDGTSSNRATIIFYGGSAVVRFYVANGGVAQADSVFSISYTFNQRNKIAFRYKQNDFKAYINGTQVFSDTSGNTPTGLSRFDFANSNGTANFIEAEINQAIVFNEALSDSELQTLTS